MQRKNIEFAQTDDPELLIHTQMAQIICLNLQFDSQDTRGYSIGSFHPWESNCFTDSLHAGTCFHKNFWHLPSSCSAVLTAIHGPLHLQRSQHYQLPPSLWWQLSSFCLPGLQPLPPPALSLLPFTGPARLIRHQIHNLALACAVVCMWNICFVSVMCPDEWLRPDVCWDLRSYGQEYECFVWTNSTAVKLWVGSLSSLLYLKGPDRFFFIHEVIYGSSADLLI